MLWGTETERKNATSDLIVADIDVTGAVADLRALPSIATRCRPERGVEFAASLAAVNKWTRGWEDEMSSASLAVNDAQSQNPAVCDAISICHNDWSVCCKRKNVTK